MRVLLAALLLLPGVVRAAWHEASSAHFVVYADDREAELRRISGRLERYHAAMERMTGGMLPAPSPSNRLTVYLVRNDREVRENSGVVVSTNGIKSSTVELSMGPNALSNKTYQFDKVFSPAADQNMVFDEVVSPILDEVCRISRSILGSTHRMRRS